MLLENLNGFLKMETIPEASAGSAFNQSNFAKYSNYEHSWAAAQLLFFLKAREEIKMNDDKMSTRVGKRNSLKAPGQELTQFN